MSYQPRDRVYVQKDNEFGTVFEANDKEVRIMTDETEIRGTAVRTLKLNEVAPTKTFSVESLTDQHEDIMIEAVDLEHAKARLRDILENDFEEAFLDFESGDIKELDEQARPKIGM